MPTLTLTMILSETCATTVSGLESSSLVLAFSDTTNEKYLQTDSQINHQQLQWNLQTGKGHVWDNNDKFTSFVLCREVVLFSEVVSLLKL